MFVRNMYLDRFLAGNGTAKEDPQISCGSYNNYKITHLKMYML